MKKIYSLLLLGGLLLFGAQSLWATDITFNGTTDVVYFKNINPGNNSDFSGNWVQGVDNEHVYAYFFKDGGDSGFSPDVQLYAGTANESGAIYKIVPPAGTFEKMILVRGSSNGDWDTKWNQTKNIDLEDGKSYLTWYRYSGEGDWWYWQTAPFLLMGIGGDFSTETHAFDASFNCEVTLTAKADVAFKVKTEGTWYGWKADESTTITNTTNSSLLNNTDGAAANGAMKTTIAGNYTFNWNFDDETVTVTYPTEYSRTVSSAGAWGTICLPVAAAIKNSCATLYSIVDKNAQGVVIQETGSTTLDAGKPYIFKLGAGKTTFEVTLNNTAAPVASTTDNGLVGNYEDNHAVQFVESTAEYYILYGGEVRKAYSGCSIDSHRAFIDLGGITTRSLAPGRPIITMPLEPDNATSLDAFEASEKAVKFFENGQLLMKKNGVVYDMTGRIIR